VRLRDDVPGPPRELPINNFGSRATSFCHFGRRRTGQFTCSTFPGTCVMRQVVQLHLVRNAPNWRLNDPSDPEYVLSAKYAGRRRKGGLLQHGIEVLLWAAAGSGAIAMALSTHQIQSPPAAVSGAQAVEKARGDSRETSSSHALKHSDSRAKAELLSKMRIEGLGATFGSSSVSALTEWTNRLKASSAAAVASDRALSPTAQENLAADRPVPIDRTLLEPTITGSISASALAPVAVVPRALPVQPKPSVTQDPQQPTDGQIATVAPAAPVADSASPTPGCPRYKTYDPQTQTYRSYDGVVRRCRTM
jgi:hypothetical protein